MPNGPGDKDEEKRTPMRWTPEEPHAGFSAAEPWYAFSTDDPEITVKAQAAEPDSLLSWYKQLVKLRNETPALNSGSLDVLDTDDRSLLAFRRESADGSVVVLANLGNKEAAVELSGIGLERATNLLTGEVLGGTVTLPKTSLWVLEAGE